eukprot:693457-Pleurochrysis_carterae.AAC.2
MDVVLQSICICEDHHGGRRGALARRPARGTALWRGSRAAAATAREVTEQGALQLVWYYGGNGQDCV